MRILIAPNAFRGGPSAAWVAEALAAGVRSLGHGDQVMIVPLSDGGDGAAEVARRLWGGRRITATAHTPLGAPCEASYLLTPDRTAFIESAEASGLHRLSGMALDPLRASTRGTGELMRDALARGARRLVIMAGGTASVDMGAGALGALGVRFLDERDRELPTQPVRLGAARKAVLGGLPAALAGVPVTVLSDVAIPLDANIAQFGAQKGIGAAEAIPLWRALDALGRCFGDPAQTRQAAAWLGAGGGLAAGLHAVLNAEVRSGSRYFIEASGLAGHIREAQVVVTAEGRFDRTSLAGKLPYAVARLSARLGRPALIVTGEATVPARMLPRATACVELGTPPPAIGRACTPERARSLARALAAALSTRPRPR